MQARRKILYLDNPYAGRWASFREQALIVEALMARGDLLSIATSRSPDDFLDLGDLNPHVYDLLATNGGDGTLNRVVTGLWQLGDQSSAPLSGLPPLLYFPTGSTCDFARSLGLSLDPVMVINDALEGKDVNLDLGLSNDRQPFVYIAAFGAWVEASYRTKRERKQALGALAYILEGLKLMPDIAPIPLEVKWNGKKLQGEFIFGALMNTHSVGGLIELDPKLVDLQDGRFEFLLIRKAEHSFQYAELAAQLLNKKYDHELILLDHTDCVEFTFESPQALTVDGEFAGEALNWKLEVKKEALCLRVPPQVN